MSDKYFGSNIRWYSATELNRVINLFGKDWFWRPIKNFKLGDGIENERVIGLFWYSRN